MLESGFFKGIKQSNLKIGSYDIRVPIFYRDLMSIGIFLLAPFNKVKSLLPSPRMHPYRVTPWHSVITITAFEYKDTDIGPYNQVSIGVPFILDKKSPLFMGILRKPPVVPMIYLLYLPETTEIARSIGIDLANYNVLPAEISFEHGDEWIKCKLDTEGKNILNFSGRKIKTRPFPRETIYPITLRQGSLLQSEFNFSNCESGISRKNSDVLLEFGDHPIGMKLKELKLQKVLAYRYWPKMQAILSTVSDSYTV
jgi:hypothetical protein